MSLLAEKARFKEKVDQLIAEFNAPIYTEPLTDAHHVSPVEHVTRRHFIDPFLSALGWDLDQLNAAVAEEARTRGETTLHLDYLGINQETRVPLMIVEAKAWATAFVAPSARERSGEGREASQPISLICAAVEHCKAGGQSEASPVTAEWARYLAKLHQYVRTVHDESGHVVTRVAMLSGRWLVTFKDPKAIFLAAGRVNPLLISVYREDEFVACSEAIYDELAQRVISTALPQVVRPSLLGAYIKAADVKRAYRALWVSRNATGSHWRPRPSIEFEAALVLERNDGALLTVIDESLNACPMPHDYSDLTGHIAAISTEADELLDNVGKELGSTLAPADVVRFPGFASVIQRGNQEDIIPPSHGRPDLLRLAQRAREFLLVTGEAKHFLLEEPAVDGCAGHDWSLCQVQAQHQGAAPIFARSVEPKAFFVSQESHHCAHRIVHDRRNSRCRIDAFEEFLCCRACVLQTYCWSPQELAALPCGTVAAQASAHAVP